MAPFYLTLVRYVNSTRIAPEKMSVQVSLPRAIIDNPEDRRCLLDCLWCNIQYINICTLLKSMNCDQNV